MKIRTSIPSDIIKINHVHTAAFGEKEGPVIADLVNELFKDQTAQPVLSLVAVEGKKLIGHILFTKAGLTKANPPPNARILAPLAVLPFAQKKGAGEKLIKQGLKLLKKTGVDLVFVLGHPDYYPRFGFTPAGVLGFEAPYPIR